MIKTTCVERAVSMIFLALLSSVLIYAPTEAQLIIPKEVPREGSGTEDRRFETNKPVEERSPARSADSALVTANLLNLRATPSFSGQVKATLKEGAHVKVVRVYDEWRLVEAAFGQQGWAHGDYLLTGEEYEHAKQMMGAKRGSLQGTWRGLWEKRKDDKSDSILHIFHPEENTIVAAVTVKGWTCWQIFVGKIEGDQVLLQGVTVAKNQKPVSHYVLDILVMKLSENGLRLEGGWSDDEGSAGKVEYRFYALEETMDRDIWEILKNK